MAIESIQQINDIKKVCDQLEDKCFKQEKLRDMVFLQNEPDIKRAPALKYKIIYYKIQGKYYQLPITLQGIRKNTSILPLLPSILVLSATLPLITTNQILTYNPHFLPKGSDFFSETIREKYRTRNLLKQTNLINHDCNNLTSNNT